jgi:hypothetical protein
LAPTIREAGKYRDLSSASRRMRRAGGVIQSDSKNKNLQCQGDATAQEERILLSSTFLIRAVMELDDAHHIIEVGFSVLSVVIQMLISSGNTLTDTPRNNVLPPLWASLFSVRLTQKIDYHSHQPGN